MSMSASEVPSHAFHPPVAGAAGTDGTVAGAEGGGGLPAGVRAQILATEHWSLLATRSMTWSEIMSRITIHLTIASASLVVLALMAQASGFGGAFRIMAIGLTAAVLALGSLTSLRVMNASNDDAAMVVGMNRLRAAYVEMDPTVRPYLVTSTYDDEKGLRETYSMGWPRSTFSHVIASTSFFIIIINSIVAGTLVALITAAANGPSPVVATLGAAGGLTHLGGQLLLAKRFFNQADPHSRFPHPPAN